MISIIGRGNVASHLYAALKDNTDVCLVNPRTLENLDENSSLVLLAVADRAIKDVTEALPKLSGILAHTAGSVTIPETNEKFPQTGVFYPLQTFTKGAKINYSEIPVFIEGSSKETEEKLKDIASKFTNKIYVADSETRKKLHLASVFACNFTNALSGVAQNLLSETEIPFSVLLPLMKQTVKKLETLSPQEAQTGPAVRNDKEVMDSHIEMLSQHEKYRDIYVLMSSLIQNENKNIRN